jgi:hypothetical protein
VTPILLSCVTLQVLREIRNKSSLVWNNEQGSLNLLVTFVIYVRAALEVIFVIQFRAALVVTFIISFGPALVVTFIISFGAALVVTFIIYLELR